MFKKLLLALLLCCSTAQAQIFAPSGTYGTWTPTLVGFSANPTSSVYEYVLNGKLCCIAVRQGSVGTSNATNFTISLPFTASSTSNAYYGGLIWDGTDNSAALNAPAQVTIAGGGTVMTLFKNFSGGLWTASGNKAANLNICYMIA